MFRRLLGITVIIECVALMTVSIVDVPRVFAGTCSGNLEVQQRQSSFNAYGTKGTNGLRNPQVAIPSTNFFVNSTWVLQSGYDLAEIGWTRHGGEIYSRHFISTMDKGYYWHNPYSVASASSNIYETYADSSAVWHFYANSGLLASRSLSFSYGYAGAMQERNNTCDTVDNSHWWSLKKALSPDGYNIVAWSTNSSSSIDNDPDYHRYAPSNDNFWVIHD